MSADGLDLVIVGAGPTGLSLALEAARHDLSFRLVDRAEGPSTRSKALAVQARTLEIFDAWQVAETAVAAGQPLRAIHARSGGERVATLRFDGLESPYPFPLILAQSKTERILADRLTALGGAVEWRTEMTGLRRTGDGVVATVDTPAGGEEIEARWIAGCDGAHSAVRRVLDLPFEGEAYPEEFVLGDVKIDWHLAADEGHAFFHGADLLVALPLGEPRRWRLIATRRREEETGEDPDLAEVRRILRGTAGMKVDVTGPEWLASFRLHRRIVPRFRVGRAFLLGDAAHIHSPAGGQGMNTGVQDARNLGWKLGLAASGRAGDRILDTYDAERRPVAETILRWTDVAFRVALGQSALARAVRRFAPAVALDLDVVSRRARRLVSQLGIAYPDSPIVGEAADAPFGDGPEPGDRAPDAPLPRPAWSEGARVFDLLREPLHVVLLFGTAAGGELAERFAAAVARSPIREASIHAVPVLEAEAAGAYGVGRAGAVLVRPDGHVAWRGPLDPAPLERFLDCYR